MIVQFSLSKSIGRLRRTFFPSGLDRNATITCGKVSLSHNSQGVVVSSRAGELLGVALYAFAEDRAVVYDFKLRRGQRRETGALLVRALVAIAKNGNCSTIWVEMPADTLVSEILSGSGFALKGFFDEKVSEERIQQIRLWRLETPLGDLGATRSGLRPKSRKVSVTRLADDVGHLR
jgi:hypothetical protein